MRKRITIISISIVLIALFAAFCVNTIAEVFGLGYSYDNWHEEYINKAGTLKIPDGWHTEVFDNGVAMLDSDDNICMIGFYGKAYKYKDIYVSCQETVSSVALSNSACYGKKRGQIGNQNRDVLFLSLFCSPRNLGSITFYAYDESITLKTVKQIAKSFEMITSKS